MHTLHSLKGDTVQFLTQLVQRWWLTVSLSGPALIIISELFLVLSGVTIKQVSQVLPTSEIVFFRNFFALLILLPWLYQVGIKRVKTQRFHLHLLRASLGVSAMGCLFYAWGALPLAQAALLKQTSPFFIPLIALLWLGETLRKRVVLALIIGFVGVFAILNPQSGVMQSAVIIALLGAFISAFAKVTIRKMGQTEDAKTIVFYFSLIASILSLIPALYYWRTPNITSLLWLVLLAVSSTLAQLLMSRAYGLSKAGLLAPFTYVSVGYAAVIGWLFWSEGITFSTIVGILLICGAGVLTLTGVKR